MAKTGSLTINSENIFPIIKKWLYSDHDIFYRELVSNGCDAITKLKKLEIMGEWQKPEDVEFKITVTVDSNEKTITFADKALRRFTGSRTAARSMRWKRGIRPLSERRLSCT